MLDPIFARGAKSTASSSIDWDAIDTLIDEALQYPIDQQEQFLYQKINDKQTAELAIGRLKAESFSTQFLITAGWHAQQDKLIPIGTIIDAWQIDQALGSGGMGEVYKVRRTDGLYEQIAAMKLVSFDDIDARELFERERRTQAKLEHPNIARMIDGGQASSGQHYLVTEYIEGLTLNDYVHKNSCNERQLLKLFLGVCSGLSHAHARLVLHCDIKPKNIIVLPTGQIKIIDFGIALNLANPSYRSDYTPYTRQTAAPEQLSGDEMSVSTDIFALGILLQTLLSEKPVQRTTNGSLVVSDDMPADIRAIVYKATAEKPEQRYASVDVLANDVKFYLDDYPVSARPLTARYQLAKIWRRHSVGVSLGIALIFSLFVGLATSIHFARQAQQESNRAKLALQKTERALSESEHSARLEQATNQAFQSLFSSGGNNDDAVIDINILKEGLITYAQKQFEQLPETPETASYSLVAIGSIFIMRNDYPSAIAVLQPWVSNDQAPERIQAIRDALLGRAFLQTGKTDKALPLLRRSIDLDLERDSDYVGSASHAASVSTYAVASNQNEDRHEALRVLTLAIKRDEETTGGFYHPFFYNEIGVHKRQLGDIKGAISALQMGIESQLAIDPNRVINTDNTYVNLATLQLYALDDREQAAESLQEVERIAHELKGESWILARALFIKAELYLRSGELDAAKSALARSDELSDTFLGEDRPDTIQYTFKKMRIELAQGNLKEAEFYFNQFAESSLTAPSETLTDIETALAMAFFAHYQGDNNQLELVLRKIKQLLGEKTPSLRHGYLLQRLGLVI